MKQNIPIVTDTTLRDGEQAPGVVFSLSDKLRIAQILDKLGVQEVEVGIPAINKKELYDIKALVNHNFSFRTLCWCRANVNDVLFASRTGSEGVHFAIPVSAIQLKAMGKDYAWALKSLREIYAYASSMFSFVSVGAQDASRANPVFLKEFCSLAQYLGANKLRISDTVGQLDPFSSFELVKNVLAFFKNGVEFHGHNDLGMATANTIAAAKAGAKYLNVSIGGLGERAGNAPLEEVVMALKKSMTMPVEIKTKYLNEACSLVAKSSKRKIHPAKAIVGDKVFSHESGIHVNGQLKDKKAYQLFKASEVGVEEAEIILGKHSGKSSVVHFFKKKGISISNDEAITILDKVKYRSQARKRGLTEDEVMLAWMEE